MQVGPGRPCWHFIDSEEVVTNCLIFYSFEEEGKEGSQEELRCGREFEKMIRKVTKFL